MGALTALAAPGCMKAKKMAQNTAKMIRNTSSAGLLLRPQPTVKKTPRKTPSVRRRTSR
jgi:hypothetical protein